MRTVPLSTDEARRKKRRETLERHLAWKKEELAHSKAIDRVISVPILAFVIMVVLVGAIVALWPK